MTDAPNPREILLAYGIEAEAVEGVLDLHASELARQQRAGIPEIMESWGGSLHQDMLGELIDLIDPGVKP